MKIDELVKKLDQMGVSKSEYSIGKEDIEKYCLIKTELSYHFFYLEKPQKFIIKYRFFKPIYDKYNYKSLHKWFDTEEEVCNFFFIFFNNNKFIDKNWTSIKDVFDYNFEIKGINIWDYESEWKNTGKFLNVKDSKYEQRYFLDIYEIKTKDLKIKFAITELTNGVWGICVPDYFEEDSLKFSKIFSLREFLKQRLNFFKRYFISKTHN